MDNGTMMEALKYLNYYQLAKSSLTSKRFRNLIRTHRNTLALLYVDYMGMLSNANAPDVIKIFDQKLSPEAYDEWVMRNNYSKQAPLEDQVATAQCTQNVPKRYELIALAYYKDSHRRGWAKDSPVFIAEVELNDDNWPAYQHFIRLLTDPFIYINNTILYFQNVFLNALSGAVNSDRRLQCIMFCFNLKGNSQKCITWTKNHVRCNEFYIHYNGNEDLNLDEALIDFFMTGAHCTSEFNVGAYDLSKTVVDFVQKFMDLKSSHESQLVQAINGTFKIWNHDYAEFIVKEEIRHQTTVQIFQFVNNDIGKKLQLTVRNFPQTGINFSIKIIKL